MESEPEFLAKTQRSQATKKRRKPNLEFLRLGSFASLREKSCAKNKKLRTCITEKTLEIRTPLFAERVRFADNIFGVLSCVAFQPAGFLPVKASIEELKR